MSLLISGLAIGSVYGLLAASFAVVLRATGVLNLANVAFFVIAPFLMWQITREAPSPLIAFVATMLLVAVLVAVIAWMLQRLAIRRLQDAPFFALVIATLALDTIILSLAGSRDEWRIYPREVGSPWPGRNVSVFGSQIPANSILVIVTAAAVVGLTMLLIGRSRWGLAFQGASMHREAATSLGVDLGRVSALAWIAGGVLAAIGGILLGMYPRLVTFDASPGVAFRALPALVIGGMYSVPGAALGGALVGVVEVFVARYAPAAVGHNFHFLSAYILMFVVLVITKEGIIGRKTVERL